MDPVDFRNDTHNMAKATTLLADAHHRGVGSRVIASVLFVVVPQGEDATLVSFCLACEMFRRDVFRPLGRGHNVNGQLTDNILAIASWHQHY